MNRKEWKFSYTAARLAEAAEAMLRHHESRLAYWKGKKDEVFGLIRSEGIEVDEKISLGYRHPKERDWERGAQVMVRIDLQKDLDECLEKLGFHTGRIADYDGWQQMLAANPEQRLELDIEDWLFFFGRV